MGIGDFVNKAKAALGNEKQTDSILDKGAALAKDKFQGREDKIDQVRDAIDGKIGDEKHRNPGANPSADPGSP